MKHNFGEIFKICGFFGDITGSRKQRNGLNWKRMECFKIYYTNRTNKLIDGRLNTAVMYIRLVRLKKLFNKLLLHKKGLYFFNKLV